MGRGIGASEAAKINKNREAALRTGTLPDAVQRRNAGRPVQDRAGAGPEPGEM